MIGDDQRPSGKTRSSAHEKVDCSNVIFSDLCKIAEVRRVRETVRENRAWERFYFCKSHRRPPKGLPPHGRRFYS